MKSGNEMEGMLEILLSVPGMEESVKVGINLSRKQVMLMNNVIREGMAVKGGMVEDLLKVLPNESGASLQQMADELLEKAGLTALHAKVSKFRS